MKLSLNKSNNKIENVLPSLQRYRSQGIFRKDEQLSQERRNTRRISSQPWLESRFNFGNHDKPISSPSCTSPSLSVPLIGMNPDVTPSIPAEDIVNVSENIDKENDGVPIQEVMNILFRGNKETSSSITKKDLYNVIDELKNIGEKYFDQKENSNKDELNEDAIKNNQINNQLATPMTTPLDNDAFDETLIATAMNNKVSVDGINLLNYSLSNSNVINTMPSPDILSPIQPNINTFDIINPCASTPCQTPFIQSTPFDTVMNTPVMIPDTPALISDDTIMGTPALNSIIQNTIVAQDEIDPFKSPAPATPNALSLLGSTSNLLAPSPIVSTITTPLDVNSSTLDPLTLLNETLTPKVDNVADLVNQLPSNAMTRNTLFDTIANSPFPDTLDSLALNSPAIQNDLNTIQNTPFIFSPLATPSLNVDDSLVTDSLFAGASKSTNGVSPLANEVYNSNDVQEVDQKNTGLEEVNDLLMSITGLIKNGTPTTINADTSDENEIRCDESFGAFSDDISFPSRETIKNCKVKELEFDFSEDNISKLVRLSPVEVVQEDVIKLQNLAKQKRGKGRPRKPRKFSICPFESCQKKFNREFNLKEHIRIHNPNRSKKFICKYCNECFYSSSVLSRHVMSIHEGEKFLCKNCGKAFNRKDALHRHEKTSCQKAQCPF